MERVRQAERERVRKADRQTGGRADSDHSVDESTRTHLGGVELLALVHVLAARRAPALRVSYERVKQYTIIHNLPLS